MYQNLISFLGIFLIAGLAWISSSNKKNVNWSVVLWGIGFQIFFAFVIFKLPLGIAVFSWLNGLVIKLLSFSKAGIGFLFGPLALSPGETGPAGEASIGFILAFQALPTIIFFSALIALLYHLKVMQFAVNLFAHIHQTDALKRR